MKKRFLVFGGRSSVGKIIMKSLANDFDFIDLNSSVCDVKKEENIEYWCNFYNYDGIIYLPVVNIDGLLHLQTSQNIKDQIDVNIYGFLTVLRYSTEKMRKNKFGRVIYISSVLSKSPVKGAGIYSATKAFCDNIIKTYSLENSKYCITSNSIQLGYFDGGLTNKIPNEFVKSIINNIPLKRLGNLNEIPSLVKTIIDTEYINGTTISINGGYE